MSDENITSGKTHKDLQIWQEGIDLVMAVYEVTNSFPQEEKYNLTSQIRRCVVSVPSNIAEGATRNSTTQYIQFVNIALASLAELETQLMIVDRLGYCNAKEILEKVERQRRKMINFLKHLKTLR